MLDHAADVVRQPAVRVRDVRPALHHQDLGLLVEPAQARRTRRAAGDAADDDHLHDALTTFSRYFLYARAVVTVQGSCVSTVARLRRRATCPPARVDRSAAILDAERVGSGATAMA